MEMEAAPVSGDFHIWLNDCENMSIWVFPKIGKHPKTDGENNGKPY